MLLHDAENPEAPERGEEGDFEEKQRHQENEEKRSEDEESTQTKTTATTIDMIMEQQQDTTATKQNTKESSCSKTTQLAWGPIFYPNDPILTTSTEDGAVPSLCRHVDNDGHMYLATSIWKRTLIDMKTLTLHLRGHVLDSKTCEPIPNAIVDFWHPDSKGKYHIDDCRGSVTTDSNGFYSVNTYMPGSYGITAGIGGSSLIGRELPPYSLRHVHVAVFAPDHKTFVSQMSFPDDPTRGYDFRELLSASPVQLSSLDMQVELNQNDDEDGTHTINFDFVVEPIADEDGVPTKPTGLDLYQNLDALRDDICPKNENGDFNWMVDLNYPLPLCYPNFYQTLPPHVLFSLLPIVMYGIPITVLTGLGFVFKKLFFGFNNKKKKQSLPSSSSSNKEKKS